MTDTSRFLIAAVICAAGFAVATWLGAPAGAALIAAAAGLVGAAVAHRLKADRLPSHAAERHEPRAGDQLPSAAELIGPVEEPILLVRGRRVLLANPAARAMLGEHIEGVDVRLAIRHPAAAERLVERGEDRELTTRTELVGLGEADRRWEMVSSRLDDGSFLVRLADRSAAHAAERMRTDFVANASHELRTPLATLLGFLETLEDDEAASDPKTRRRFLGIMLSEATRMRQLVDDLMSLSRIEAERFTVPRDPVDLVPLIEEARVTLDRLIEEKKAELVVEARAGSTTVAGDRAQLAQLLHNLLSNALKYGRPGAPVRICLDDARAEFIRLSVVDQGEGIASEHLPRLTERFYRVDAGRSRSVGGTGLGLAIVKHIVGRHRGRLEIDSKIGEGTAVRVFLPRGTEAPSQKSHVSVTGESPSGDSDR
jgi:two-component system phosphate regulon sensor histidine kinase PhoR